MNNADRNHVSLLIQGPIYSFGDTYSGIKSEFHSMEFIIQNVKAFRKYSNGEILLSTYETQLSLNEANFLRKLEVTILELEIRDMSEFKTINLNNNPDTNRHGINQYYSTYHGLIKLSNNPDNRFVIKIRTDINIDFSLIFDSKINPFNKKVTFTNLRKIFKWVSFVKPFIPDLVLIGEISSLHKLFKRLYLNNFSSFVHLDLATGLLWMFTGLSIEYDKLITKTKTHSKIRYYYLFHYYLVKFLHAMIITFYIKRKIGILGEQFCDSIEWRGTRRVDYSYNRLIEIFK